MAADELTLSARWLFPAAGPPLPGGTLTVRGDRIAAVDPAGVRSADVDLGNVGLIPGLVNAHTHLDLSGARGRTPPTSADRFTDWLRTVIAFRRSRSPDEVAADVRAGLAELLGFGTTLVGDIASSGASWDAVSHAPVRAVVFRELIGLAPGRGLAALAGMRDWLNDRPGSPTVRPGVSPHAPYSASAFVYQNAGGYGARRLPAATHLAESAAEAELLRTGGGPFRLFLEAVGAFAPDQLVRDWADVGRLLSAADPPSVLLVHANYLPADFPFHRLHTVVYCPRTHAAFGHPPHPFRQFHARGVRVCLGTDGLSSNPDLDVLAEARFVRSLHPDLPGDVLLKMATLSGAEALGWADEAGSLEPGKSADAVAVPLPDRDAADPYDLLFASDAPPGPRRTLFRGRWRSPTLGERPA